MYNFLLKKIRRQSVNDEAPFSVVLLTTKNNERRDSRKKRKRNKKGYR